jgi:transcriptional antiterminator NusG
MDVQEPEDRLEKRPVDEENEAGIPEEPSAPSESAPTRDSDPEAPAEESAPADSPSTEAAVSSEDAEETEALDESPAAPQVDSAPAAVAEDEAPSEPALPVDDEPVLETEEAEPAEAPAAHAEVAPIAEPAAPPEDTVPPDVPAGDSPDGPAWYVVHCYSGYENKVRHNLEQRIETMGMKDKIFDVTQEEIEVKEGKRRTVERHIFPGYVLVNMMLSEESWYVVRNTPGVTGFVGMGNQPTPLRPEEVSQIIKRMEAEAPTVKVTFKVGERVRIIDGPFNDFRGVVAEIDMERTKVRVMVSFFGRETPVELDFLQVEKA